MPATQAVVITQGQTWIRRSDGQRQVVILDRADEAGEEAYDVRPMLRPRLSRMKIAASALREEYYLVGASAT